MPHQEFTIRNLFHPLAPEDFVERYFDKTPVYIPGKEDKFRHVFSWEECNRLLNMTTLWSDQTMKMALDGRNLTPSEFCVPGITRDGHNCMRPDSRLVAELLDQGATLVLDLIERLAPGIAGVTGALEVVFGAPTSCNAYCSWGTHQAFPSHFDTMDVFALHVEGTKTWRIYEGRFENPAELPGFNYSSLPPDYHEKAKGKVLKEAVMTPGDMIYLPKGQYHDALASSEACLHLSFGVTRPIGHDLIGIVARSLPDEPLFRASVPHYNDIEAHRDHLRKLADKLHELITLPETSSQIRDHQRRRACRSLRSFALPAREQAALYQVHSLRAKLVRRGGGWLLTTAAGQETLSADEAEVARWVLQREHFNADAMAGAFDNHDPAALAPIVEKLTGAGLIQAL